MTIRRLICLLALLAGLQGSNALAQSDFWKRVALDNYDLDSTKNNALGVQVDAMAFFRDNEFDSPIQRGYSLPGMWLRPKLTYQALHHINLELGLHATIFDGANKYPNYAYHDVAKWKGNQYQKGAHVLPWFRAQASFKHLSIVLGDIYGAQNHRLILPMFNPEQNLSADPEMGLQLLLDRRHIHLDTWINWQSYQFEDDSHQETFTIGTNATILLGKKSKAKDSQPRALAWSIPIQLLIQHRGGEQDTTYGNVETLCNASAGVRMDFTPRRPSRWLTSLNAQLNVLASYQQSGDLWPFDSGFAMHAAVGLQLWKHLDLEVGHFDAPRQYANLYGTPFMGTLSLKNEGQTYHGTHTTYLHAGYSYAFSPAYRLGANLEAMRCAFGSKTRYPFSFGVTLHVCPSFVLKRFH